ncbi:SgcJ/EcaC family oxidoreductase [Gemmatimonadota bacterium]
MRFPMALDPETIKSLIVRYFHAFAVTKDANEIADLFASDGDLMGVDGTFIQGRDAIRDHYAVELSGDLGGLRVGEPVLTAVRDLGSMVLADARWDLFGPGSEEPIATPAGFFVMNSDEDGSPMILAARIMVPQNLG